MSKESSKDRASLCTFTFSDGRRCNLPQSADDMGLCYFHAQKFNNRARAQAAGQEISQFLNTDILTACDLNSAFATLFAATAQGLIKPKTTATLAYLGQLMLQTQRLAKEEYLEAFEGGWDEVTHQSPTFALPEPPLPPANDFAPSPSGSPTPADVSEAEATPFYDSADQPQSSAART